jgi:hypothetical protein
MCTVSSSILDHSGTQRKRAACLRTGGDNLQDEVLAGQQPQLLEDPGTSRALERRHRDAVRTMQSAATFAQLCEGSSKRAVMLKHGILCKRWD